MPLNRVDYIDNNSRFYQDSFRKLITFSYIMMTLAFILFGVIVYQDVNRPTPKYFVATSDGRLIEIHSLYELQQLRAAGAEPPLN
jgi:hypothetical protein